MFDIGFWEIAVIGVIALLVVGPERLPGLARTVGRWVGRMRRYVSHVKQDIEREIHADEVRQMLEKPEGLESIRDVARETAAVFEDTRKELDSVVDNARADIKGDTPGAGNADATGNLAHDDPFAPSSVAKVSPTDPADAAPGESADPPVSVAERADAPASADPTVDEQRTEQTGQR